MEKFNVKMHRFPLQVSIVIDGTTENITVDADSKIEFKIVSKETNESYSVLLVNDIEEGLEFLFPIKDAPETTKFYNLSQECYGSYDECEILSIEDEDDVEVTA